MRSFFVTDLQSVYYQDTIYDRCCNWKVKLFTYLETFRWKLLFSLKVFEKQLIGGEDQNVSLEFETYNNFSILDFYQGLTRKFIAT